MNNPSSNTHLAKKTQLSPKSKLHMPGKGEERAISLWHPLPAHQHQKPTSQAPQLDSCPSQAVQTPLTRYAFKHTHTLHTLTTTFQPQCHAYSAFKAGILSYPTFPFACSLTSAHVFERPFPLPVHMPHGPSPAAAEPSLSSAPALCPLHVPWCCHLLTPGALALPPAHISMVNLPRRLTKRPHISLTQQTFRGEMQQGKHVREWCWHTALTLGTPHLFRPHRHQTSYHERAGDVTGQTRLHTVLF